jgi:hypothetical protein
MNINSSTNNIYVYEEETKVISEVTLKEMIELYEKSEIKFDNTFFKESIYYGSQFLKLHHISECEIFKQLLENGQMSSNKNVNMLIPFPGKNKNYKVIYNNEIKKTRLNSSTILNISNNIDELFNKLTSSKETLQETQDIINEIKTINFYKNENGIYIDLSSDNLSNEITRAYFIREYLDVVGKDLTKDKSFNYTNNKRIYLNNINEIYFIKHLFEDKLNYNIDNLSQEDQEYLINTTRILENKIEQTSYNENIKDFLNYNKEGAVISDSVEEKNSAVIEWFNEKKEEVLILGKPEALEKYQNLGFKNGTYISLDDLSSKTEIDEIQTSINNYKLIENELYVNNVKTDIENIETLKFDVDKNRPLLLNMVNQKNNIKNGDVKTIIRNIELSKILTFIENNFELSPKDISTFFNNNILNKDITQIINDLFIKFNIDISNPKTNEKLKKFTKINKKSELKLEDVIEKITKNLEFNKKTNEFDIVLKNINMTFNQESISDNRIYDILNIIDKKNQNKYFSEKLKNGNDFTIKNNELFYDENINFIEGIESEVNKVEYFSTKKLKEVMEKIENIENILILNAEKLKSPTSTISNVFLYMMKNKTFKNKVFVSSNPIYNKIAEIEIIFKSINQNLFVNLSNVLDSYNTRKVKDNKEGFLGVIAKRYILKRSAEELSSLLENGQNVKQTSFYNPKQLGNLKKESEYFDVLRDKLEDKVRSIVEISLSRLQNNREFDINEKVMFDTHKEKYLEYYFENYDNFQILLGKKLNSYEYRKITNIINENNIKSLDVTKIQEYSISEIEKELSNISEFKKVMERRKLLINSFYEKIMNNKFKKYATFDIETNELIDGVNIKKKHINNITEIVNSEKDLTAKEKELFLSSLIYNSNIEEYLYGVPNDRSRYKTTGIENIIGNKIKVLKSPAYYSSEFSKYREEFDENITRTNSINKVKIFQKVSNRIKKELLGEDISFKEILMRSFNMKTMRRQLSELKVPNTLKEVEFLHNENKNSLVLSTSNDVIKELEEKLKAEGKNVIIVKSQNKNEIMKNLKNEKSPYVVLAGFKMLSEHIDNEFEGEIILNDLPFNYASLEQSVASIKKQDLQFWYLHNEEEEFEKLFKFVISSRNKEIKQLISSKDEIFENFDVDEEYFKENFVKNVFNKILNNMTKENFDELIGLVKQKYNYKKAIAIEANKIAEDIVFF